MKRFLSTIISLIFLLSYLIINPEVKVFASSNLAAGIIPTASASVTNISRLTDGDKNTNTYYSASAAGLQWVQLDLGTTCNINDIKLWHYYGDKRSYHDVIVQLSNDSTFSTGVTTVFNNDTDNSSRLGAGTNSEYMETSTGKDISFNVVNARYVRFYTNGNTVNAYNHYVEVEIYGDSTVTPTPITSINLAAGIIPTASASVTSISRLTDGDKNTNTYYSASAAGLQWVQLDLRTAYNVNNIKLWHYYGDKRSYHDVIVQLSNDSTFSTGVTTVFNNDTDNSSRLGAGTNSEYMETSAGKDISFNAVNARYVRFYTNGNTVNAYNHYVEVEIYDGFTVTPPPTPTQTPKLLFTFDDGNKDNITVAAPILNAKGFKATAYVCRDRVIMNSSNYMNISDLNTLYSDYGWDIGNHTVDHNNALGPQENGYNTDTVTLQTLKQEYLDNQTWILSNNWTRGAYHAAYPYGVYTTQLIDILKGIGVKTGRAAWGGIEAMPVSNFYTIPVQEVQDGNVTVVQKQIDEAVRTNSTLILMIHHVQDTTGSYVITTSDFQTIVDYVSKYVQEGKLDVTTISKWYDSVK